MNKRTILTLLFITTVMLCSIPTPAIADTINYQDSVDIAPNSHAWSGSGDGQYNGMYGTFEVTDGSGVTFFILTPYDFSQFHNYDNPDVNRMHLIENVTDGIINFRLPQSLSYFYVFVNDDDTTQHIVYEIYKDMTGPEIVTDLIDNTTYSYVVPITVSAIDLNFGISYIQLFINEVMVSSTYNSSFLAYDWDTTTYPDSQQVIRIRAADNVVNDFGDIGNLAEVVMTVQTNNIDPTTSTTTTTTNTTTTGTDTTTGQSGVLPTSVPIDLTFLMIWVVSTAILLTILCTILIMRLLNPHGR